MLESTALIFPGQGSQSLKMLEKARVMADFNKLYPVIKDQLHLDLFSEIEQGGEVILNKNAVSSIMTVFFSALHLEQFKRENPLPSFFAGYSVGQWSAIYASGAITFEMLIRIVHQRAKLMDEVIEKTKSGMLAVIGLPVDIVESVCLELRNKGQKIWISNYNAPSQYSLAGTVSAIEEGLELLQTKSPKKVALLPVAGGWHSPLLESAGASFMKFLTSEKISIEKDRVIDNVTGDFLPPEKPSLDGQLGAHLYSPVLWEKGVKSLIARDVKTFSEIGFGNLLTKYDFFIDRAQTHNPGLS